MYALGTAVGSFREAYLTAGMEGFERDLAMSSAYDFQSPEARATRYDILWAYYQGNAYRTIHKWAKKLKADYGLYVYIRDIYSPANRICNFHQGHIWGGHLDPMAGDGSESPTALPIIDTEDNVRTALSRLWRDSRFAATKDIYTLLGSVLGDIFIKVVEYPEREKVVLERVHPGWVVDMRWGPLREITYYEIAYMRPDPEKGYKQNVEYREIAELESLSGPVHYMTLREGKPYAWDGENKEWTVDYPFIPMVHIQHNDVGLEWGWSELFPKLSTFREVDDQASKLSDQIRKLVDSPWMISGVRPGKTGGNITIEGLGSENSPNSSEITREETPIIYAYEVGARAQALVAELDIRGALDNVKQIVIEIEKSYPELRTGLWEGTSGQGGVSGRALLMARQEAEDKIHARRVLYDEGLITAHRMAIAIGGEAGYKDYKGFGLADWASDKTDHKIDPTRIVFKPHPSESLDWARQLWANAYAAERVGVPLDLFLQDQEWEEDRIKAIINSEFYQMHLALLESQIVQTTPDPNGQVMSDESSGDAGDTGDQSGRGSPSTAGDFNVPKRQATEG